MCAIKDCAQIASNVYWQSVLQDQSVHVSVQLDVCASTYLRPFFGSVFLSLWELERLNKAIT